jgi:hypothetical protein
MIVHRRTWHNDGLGSEQQGPVVLERPGRFLRGTAGTRDSGETVDTRGGTPAASVEQRVMPEASDGIERCSA